MKKQLSASAWAGIAGLLLVLPAIYFVLISVMAYGFGWRYLFDASWPLLERLGVKESLGWNINLLIIFGPVLALLLNVWRVLHIDFEFTKERIDCRFSLLKSWQNLAIVILSGGVLTVLMLYLFLENCRC